MANELLLKLGIRLSPRTVSKYLPGRPRGRPRGDLRWSTFLRLHAQGIIACGTIRRECLDWLIPLSEAHLRFILKSWIAHYNGRRPHMALGPGVPDPPIGSPPLSINSCHRRGESFAIRAKSILGGLHHEYSLVSVRA